MNSNNINNNNDLLGTHQCQQGTPSNASRNSSSNGTTTTVVVTEGNNKSPPPPPTTTTTTNIDTGTTLQQDIASKQLGRIGKQATSVKPGAFSVAGNTSTTNGTATTTTTTAAPNDLLNVEADILAKQGASLKGRSSANDDPDIIAKQKGRTSSSSSVTTRPGAYAESHNVSTTKSTTPSDLQDIEADILAKKNGTSRGRSIPVVVPAAASSDPDVIAKQMGRSSSTSSSKPGAYSTSNSNTTPSDLLNVEADILAKRNGAAARERVVHPSSVGTTATTNDPDILAKQKGRSTNNTLTPVQPGAYSARNATTISSNTPVDLFNVEADILAKQQGKSVIVQERRTSNDPDVIAKQMGRSTCRSGEAGATAVPGAYSAVSNGSLLDPPIAADLQNFHSDVLAKQKAAGVASSSLSSKNDPDLIAKQMGRSTSAVGSGKPGAYSATSATTTKTSTPADLHAFNADVFAKQEAAATTKSKLLLPVSVPSTQQDRDMIAKEKGRSSVLSNVKPGAYLAVTAGSGSVPPTDLESFNADVLAKQTAAAGGSTIRLETVLSSSSQDPDVIAKQKGRTTSTARVIPGAHADSNVMVNTNVNKSDLSTFEADVLAKQTAGATRLPVSSTLSTLESDVVAKQKGKTTSVVPIKPGATSVQVIPDSDDAAPSDLNYLEADILTKQTAGATRTTNLSSMSTHNADVIAKQKGIAISVVPVQPGTASLQNKSFGDDAACTDLNNMESDILSKQMGRTAASVSVKPGAHSSTNAIATSNDMSDLSSFEADVLYKQTAGASRLARSLPNNNGTTAELTDFEADIRAKQMMGASRMATSTSTSDVNGKKDMSAHELVDFEYDVRTKQTAKASKRTDTPMEIKNDCITSTDYLDLEEALLEKERMTSPIQHDRKVNINPTLPDAALTDLSEREEIFLRMLEANASSCRSLHQTSLNQLGNGADNVNSRANLSMSKEIFDGFESSSALEFGQLVRKDGEDLAVAVAVDDGEMDAHLPSAVEYDPDAKPPIYRNRRFRLYAAMMCVAAICGVVGALLGSILIQEPAGPQIPYRLTLGIRENIERVIAKEKLDDYTNPYRKALDWLTFTDPQQVSPNDPRFFQRYILAYFYFATSQTGPWTSDCAPSFEISKKDECKNVFVIDKFENGVDEQGKKGTNDALRWLSGTDECEWAGIYCDVMHQVLSFQLSDVGITGTFPEGFTLLPYVSDIVLNYGKLEGPLPDYIFDEMKDLRLLTLDGNMFTGTIPLRWVESRLPLRIDIQNNQISDNLSTIPKALTVREFYFSGNDLTGTIPVGINEMLNLNAFRASENKLNGTIPALNKLRRLVSLELARNFLTGTISNNVISPDRLLDFVVYDNLLTGTIPDLIYRCEQLSYFRIGNNNMSGTISGKISKFTNLREFDISNNQFTGTLPSRLPNQFFKRFRASGNKLNGTVDTNVCDLHLQELELDCAVPLGGGIDAVPEITCPIDCCTLCCTPDGVTCKEM